MAWHNPPVPWSEFEAALSGTRTPPPDPGPGVASPARAPSPDGPVVPYAELHCHSHYSFLDGVSSPEDLVDEAVRLGLTGVALTDHNGLYGAPYLAAAARNRGLATVYGAELSLGLDAPQGGVVDPGGQHLLVLARTADGYRSLAATITAAQLAGFREPDDHPAPAADRAVKGRPVYNVDELAGRAGGEWLVLTGCRKGTVRTALAHHGVEAAADELARLTVMFGRDNVAVELTDHNLPGDTVRNDLLAELAARARLPVVATNAVHYATPDKFRLAAVVAAIRARRPLDDLDGWLPPAPAAYLRSGAEMADRFSRYPGAVARTAQIAGECALDLTILAPPLPRFPVPAGESEDSHLRVLAYAGAAHRYGPRAEHEKAYAQIDHELDVIAALGFAGYFLVVNRIVEFCRTEGILCQGRGSAANSAVCYALGVTNADPIAAKLLFERFLSAARDGPPDIDIDIESDRREEVIQYVYRTYGRSHVAQVANLITYKARSAIRDVAKALGYATGQQDAWAKQLDHHRTVPTDESTQDSEPGAGEAEGIPPLVLELAAQLEGAPRHLGIHSGGMVITGTPIGEICPVENATMPGRTVLQWDKEGCAWAGLVKFDLLGLGMLSALHYTVDLIADYHGTAIDLARLDLADPDVYAAARKADTIGVFQIESRAQMSTLPRLKPETFYDLVVEVALIRPGPIQGGSVHPYLRRRDGTEPVTYAHPSLRGALEKTLGIPLFQEQLMQMAIDCAGFSPAEADQLRGAIGAKRSHAKVEALRQRFRDGAARLHDINTTLANAIFDKLAAFASYGFPESHAISFAHIVFASLWLKCHYPAPFLAGLLRAQPTGFYSPQSLVADARHHDVTIRRPDINLSATHASLEPLLPKDSTPAVRLGLASVRTISEDLAEAITAERDRNGPYRSMADLAERIRLTTPQAEALATAGVFTPFGLSRRAALWAAGPAAAHRPGHLPGTTTGDTAPSLPGMSAADLLVADVWATGISPDTHPVEFARDYLNRIGARAATTLDDIPDGTRILVAGLVTHRQRPPTAGGMTFYSLEDETGVVNVAAAAGVTARNKQAARRSPALLVRGVLHRAGGAVTISADRLENLPVRAAGESRSYR
ncbi:error-prone DNA polymerase [Allokutzneria multivorans]|uniref:Error-prone DNA polymerase n=1 Tax=Allokutzneria multivorans TaxID=1142134 RepID=A0ABP7SE88_9PSEU